MNHPLCPIVLLCLFITPSIHGVPTLVLLIVKNTDGGADGYDADEPADVPVYYGILALAAAEGTRVVQAGGQEGKILMMTTNHIDRLDAALIRPGRVDVRCHLDLCTPSQAVDMIMHFYDAPSPGITSHPLSTPVLSEPAQAASATVPEPAQVASATVPEPAQVASASEQGRKSKSTALGVSATAVSATGVGAPEASTPEVSASGVGATEVCAPKVVATGVSASGVSAPEVGATEVSAPEISASATAVSAAEVGVTEVCAPEVIATGGSAPEASATGFRAPDVSATAGSATEVSATGVNSPEVNSPDVSDDGSAADLSAGDAAGAAVFSDDSAHGSSGAAGDRCARGVIVGGPARIPEPSTGVRTVGAGRSADSENKSLVSGQAARVLCDSVLERSAVESVIAQLECDRVVSPAALQGHLMLFKDAPGLALAALPAFVERIRRSAPESEGASTSLRLSQDARVGQDHPPTLT